ncbi:unnamed protein product [Dibothriocephalus latus]|uniref:Uncharacterized protein n=1 Tax=Dibothriocephalus latus TaxID=60516 RepID=A0A3P6QU98_DIBLA|nr:unnamed protein product [Dibothriocephalus latus]
MIVCNVTSTTCMTRITLPKMLASPLPPAGVHRHIVNVSSFAGRIPFPYFSVYAGTKAFIHHFTQSLAGELVGTCVKVGNLMPGSVITAMNFDKHPGFFAPYPSDFAFSALSMLGVASESCGYFGHELQLTVALAQPEWLRTAAISRYMLIVRDRFYERQKSKDL